MPLISDLLNNTCAQLNLNDRDVHLHGVLTRTFSRVIVKLTIATSIAFGPGPCQTTCHPMTSSLMTHQRSACNHSFCAVPTLCSYTGNKAILTDPTLWEYDFVCACSQLVCNELLLWIRPVKVSLTGSTSVKSVYLCANGIIQLSFHHCRLLTGLTIQVSIPTCAEVSFQMHGY